MNPLQTITGMVVPCAAGGWFTPGGCRECRPLRDMDPHEPDVNDADLLQRTASGDREAFGLLYDRTSRVLFAIARRILRDESAAEDLLQDVYVQVWDKAATFDAAMGRPITWLITLTRNRAIDRLRSNERLARLMKSAQEEAAVWVDTGVAHAADLADASQSRIIREALGRLPAEQRQAIELAFFNGLSQTEIAGRLAAPLGTIKARIRRGLVQLRDALRPLLRSEEPRQPSAATRLN